MSVAPGIKRSSRCFPSRPDKRKKHSCGACETHQEHTGDQARDDAEKCRPETTANCIKPTRTDKRNPRINRHGSFYGSAENSTDWVPVLDPLRHMATEILHPVRDPATPSHRDDPMAPSPYWGDKPIWDSRTSNHNPMMDERGRVWFTARIRPFDNPDYCKKGSEHPSARVFPLARSTRHLSMYDANSGRFTLISTCFPTHHLVFAEDASRFGITLRTPHWRYVKSAGNGAIPDGPHLYDLQADPGETLDLAGRGLAVEKELDALLGRWLADRRAAPSTAAQELTPEEIERLRALGYL